MPTAEVINTLSGPQVVEYMTWLGQNEGLDRNRLLVRGVSNLANRLARLGVDNVGVHLDCTKHFLRLVLHEGVRPMQAVNRVVQYL